VSEETGHARETQKRLDRLMADPKAPAAAKAKSKRKP
jgi:hypothetical protein